MSFNPADYAEVAERLPLFWKDCARGRIVTEIIVDDGTRIVVRAELYADIADPVPTTTGFAEEIRGSSMVNKTSALENCETSAIGRAIANCPLQAPASGPRPSRNEMQKVERLTTSPQPQVHTPSGAFATPKQIGYIKKLAKDAGLDDLGLLEMIHRELNDDSTVLELLKSHEASKIIERLK
jgi:hypothetical protein